MTKLNLPDIGSLANSASARQAINDNFAAIEDAIDNNISRDGTTPNQMEADFDLNDHKLLNVADPVDEADGVNLRSVRPLVEEFIQEIAETIIEGTARVEVFTATAGQTDFPLQESPGTVSNLMLIDSGIVMTPGVDYTLTGGDLKTATFFVGRDVGNEIVARYTQLAPADSVLRSDLLSPAADKGAALMKYKRTDTGATNETVLSRLLSLPRTPVEFNAVADGVTNDTAAVNAAVAAGREVELVGDHLVTSVTNPLGSEFKGVGRVLKAITGGQQQLNSRADIGQHVFGQEYLSAFHKIILNKQDPATILMSGDSTTAGDSTTSPHRPWEILQILGVERGHEITTTNGGHSGKDTSEWVSTYLTADLATNPDLYIVRWGINDPYNGRTIQQFATSLRQGLAQIRASKTLAQMSVLLMSPNSTSDTPNGRDEKWYEQARLVCRQAARDYQCCFIDTYALWRDSRPAAGVYMDNPFGDGRAIHPANVMNAWIYSRVADVLFPPGLRPRLFESTYGTLLYATAPNRYPYGQSLFSSAPASSDFLVTNASVLTQRTADGSVYQRAFSNFASGAGNGNYPVPQLMERSGLDATWYTPTTAPSIDLTALLQNGWVNFGATNIARAKKTNNLVTLNGLIKSGTTAATTVLFTLPAGYRPRNSVEVFLQPMGPTGSTTPVVIHVNDTGIVTLQSVGNAAFVSLSGISFEVGA